MRAAHRILIGATLCMTLGFAGCASTGSSSGTSFLYKNITVADGSAIAGEGQKVLFKGSPLVLSGTGIKVGDPLREVQLTQTDLSLVGITDTKGKGKVRIISVVPSLDTPVCEQQTHYLSEKNKGLDKMVELVTVSIDTPFRTKTIRGGSAISPMSPSSRIIGTLSSGKPTDCFSRAPTSWLVPSWSSTPTIPCGICKSRLN